MNTNLVKNNKTDAAVESAVILKFGLDVHAVQVAVCVQVDGATPQPGQMVARGRLVEWMVKLRQKYPGAQCVSCYEAGPLGYGLHRALLAAGVSNYVVTPERMDDLGRGQKTDRLDARALVGRLDRYVRGNQKALAIVRVPTEEQEQKRARLRLRVQLAATRRQLEARGRSALLAQGIQVKGPWWRPARWAELQESLPGWLTQLVRPLQELASEADRQERAVRTELEKTAPAKLPLAVGALTWVTLSREILDWSRFTNRRQVASYTGLCPRIAQSGNRSRGGSINKCGNRVIRHALLEMVWRLVRFQPQYPPVAALATGALSARQRRKHAVAAARRLAIDLWRLATGQCTAEQLHLDARSVAS
jgi:transposase